MEFVKIKTAGSLLILFQRHWIYPEHQTSHRPQKLYCTLLAVPRTSTAPHMFQSWSRLTQVFELLVGGLLLAQKGSYLSSTDPNRMGPCLHPQPESPGGAQLIWTGIPLAREPPTPHPK